MKKAVMQVGGKEIADADAVGQADICVTFISKIIPIKESKLVGPLHYPKVNGGGATFATV
jgi:hypothetical protein